MHKPFLSVWLRQYMLLCRWQYGQTVRGHSCRVIYAKLTDKPVKSGFAAKVAKYNIPSLTEFETGMDRELEDLIARIPASRDSYAGVYPERENMPAATIGVIFYEDKKGDPSRPEVSGGRWKYELLFTPKKGGSGVDCEILRNRDIHAPGGEEITVRQFARETNVNKESLIYFLAWAVGDRLGFVGEQHPKGLHKRLEKEFDDWLIHIGFKKPKGV